MSENDQLLRLWAREVTDKYHITVQQDPYRLHYHLMPPVGLLNDPNGLIQFKGVYHVFYQWNPFETAHGAKFWGHYTSRDLLHWQEEPIALAPSEWYDKNGCYSGSAIEWEGKMYLFYTGNVKQADGARETYQCLAVSEDGIHFEKVGPVLQLPKGYTAHFRDPKVWRQGDQWFMVLGAQTVKEQGAVALFHSKDLYEWEEAGTIAGSGLNGLDDFGYMWECPDLIHLDGKDILLVSPQGLEASGRDYQNLFQSGYFAGELDEREFAYEHGPFTELDRGFDFYAPQTFMDDTGRTILYGWMGMTDEAEQHQPTISHRWVHALTMPRELHFENGCLYQSPLDEMKGLRENKVQAELVLDGAGQFPPPIGGKSIELMIELLKLQGGKFTITLRNSAELIYDANKNEVILKRRNVKTGALESRTCVISSLSRIHVFLDHSSLEIFLNGGEKVFTARYFPKPDDESIAFSGEAVVRVEKWDLQGFVVD